MVNLTLVRVDTWGCQDPWWLLSNSAFWFCKICQAALCPAATLVNLFALYLLRRDCAFPPSLLPYVRVLLTGGVLISTYLLAKLVYAAAAVFVSDCPLLIEPRLCLLQEMIVMSYLCVSGPVCLAVGAERLAFAFLTFLPRRRRPGKLQISIERTLALVGCPLVTVLGGLGLAGSFVHLSWARRSPLLISCSLLEALRFPLPLCLCLTVLFLLLGGLGLLGLGARFPLWATSVVRHVPSARSQLHCDVVRLNGEILVPFAALAGLHSGALLAAAVQILGLKMQPSLEARAAVRYEAVFREAAFYGLCVGAVLAFPLCLVWQVRSLRRLLIATFPCLSLNVTLPVIRDLDLGSIHSVPDDLSRSTSHDPNLGLTAL